MEVSVDNISLFVSSVIIWKLYGTKVVRTATPSSGKTVKDLTEKSVNCTVKHVTIIGSGVGKLNIIIVVSI
jgi:hypothetical protein